MCWGFGAFAGNDGSNGGFKRNYVDYRFRNDTPHHFQLRLWLTEKTLEGELRCDHDLPHKYRVMEKNHAFLKIGAHFYRSNEIWRYKLLKCRSEMQEETLMTRNFAIVKYEPKEYTEMKGA